MLSFFITCAVLAFIEHRVVKTQKTSWKIVLALVSAILAITWGGLGYILLTLGQTYPESYSGQNLLNSALGWVIVIWAIVIFLTALIRVFETKIYQILGRGVWNS